MRGSPLLRTLLVLVALVVVGAGLTVLGRKPPMAPDDLRKQPETSGSAIQAPFVLTLSEAAESVSFESMGETFVFEPSTQVVTGKLPLESGHPTLFIDIVWSTSGSRPRFAKLTLEPAGFPTATKVFDASGNISDVWELHLHE